MFSNDQENLRPGYLRLALALLVLALLSPLTLLAQSAEDGWGETAEGLYSRESEGQVEYLAHGTVGHANLLPVVEDNRALAEEAAAEQPSEDNFHRLDGWLAIEKEVAQKASKGAVAAATACTSFGAFASTPALSCGNQAQGFAWASTVPVDCNGPFTIYAFAQAVRECGRNTQVAAQFDGIYTVAPGGNVGVASATATLTGAYSACGGDAFAYVGSGADGISLLVTNPGGSVSCATNNFTCPRCIRIIDDETF